MTREQLEHILRAAGAITGRDEWIIVGSQAVLGAVPDAPPEIEERLNELTPATAAMLRSRLRSALAH